MTQPYEPDQSGSDVVVIDEAADEETSRSDDENGNEVLNGTVVSEPAGLADSEPRGVAHDPDSDNPDSDEDDLALVDGDDDDEDDDEDDDDEEDDDEEDDEDDDELDELDELDEDDEDEPGEVVVIEEVADSQPLADLGVAADSYEPSHAAGRDEPRVAASREWLDIQAMFVDDPRGAVELAATQANSAVSALVTALQEQQAALASASGTLPGADGVATDPAETEQLRSALRGYRSLCQSLAEMGGSLPAAGPPTTAA